VLLGHICPWNGGYSLCLFVRLSVTVTVVGFYGGAGVVGGSMCGVGSGLGFGSSVGICFGLGSNLLSVGF